MAQGESLRNPKQQATASEKNDKKPSESKDSSQKDVPSSETSHQPAIIIPPEAPEVTGETPNPIPVPVPPVGLPTPPETFSNPVTWPSISVEPTSANYFNPSDIFNDAEKKTSLSWLNRDWEGDQIDLDYTKIASQVVDSQKNINPIEYIRHGGLFDQKISDQSTSDYLSSVKDFEAQKNILIEEQKSIVETVLDVIMDKERKSIESIIDKIHEDDAKFNDSIKEYKAKRDAVRLTIIAELKYIALLEARETVESLQKNGQNTIKAILAVKNLEKDYEDIVLAQATSQADDVKKQMTETERSSYIANAQTKIKKKHSSIGRTKSLADEQIFRDAVLSAHDNETSKIINEKETAHASEQESLAHDLSAKTNLFKVKEAAVQERLVKGDYSDLKGFKDSKTYRDTMLKNQEEQKRLRDQFINATRYFTMLEAHTSFSYPSILPEKAVPYTHNMGNQKVVAEVPEFISSSTGLPEGDIEGRYHEHHRFETVPQDFETIRVPEEQRKFGTNLSFTAGRTSNNQTETWRSYDEDDNVVGRTTSTRSPSDNPSSVDESWGYHHAGYNLGKDLKQIFGNPALELKTEKTKELYVTISKIEGSAQKSIFDAQKDMFVAGTDPQDMMDKVRQKEIRDIRDYNNGTQSIIEHAPIRISIDKTKDNEYTGVGQDNITPESFVDFIPQQTERAYLKDENKDIAKAGTKFDSWKKDSLKVARSGIIEGIDQKISAFAVLGVKFNDVAIAILKGLDQYQNAHDKLTKAEQDKISAYKKTLEDILSVTRMSTDTLSKLQGIVRSVSSMGMSFVSMLPSEIQSLIPGVDKKTVEKSKKKRIADSNEPTDLRQRPVVDTIIKQKMTDRKTKFLTGFQNKRDWDQYKDFYSRFNNGDSTGALLSKIMNTGIFKTAGQKSYKQNIAEGFGTGFSGIMNVARHPWESIGKLIGGSKELALDSFSLFSSMPSRRSTQSGETSGQRNEKRQSSKFSASDLIQKGYNISIKSIKDFVSNSMLSVQKVFQWLSMQGGSIYKTVKNDAASKLIYVKDEILKFIGKFKTSSIGQQFGKVYSEIVAQMSSMAGMASQYSSSIFESIKGHLVSMMSGISQSTTTVFAQLKSMVSGLSSSIIPPITSAFDFIKNNIIKSTDSVKTTFTSIIGAISNSQITQTFKTIIMKLKDFVSDISQTINDNLDAAFSRGKKVQEQPKEETSKEDKQNIRKEKPSAVSDVTEATSKKAGIFNTFEKTFSNIRDYAGSLRENSFVRSAGQGVREGLNADIPFDRIFKHIRVRIQLALRFITRTVIPVITRITAVFAGIVAGTALLIAGLYAVLNVFKNLPKYTEIFLNEWWPKILDSLKWFSNQVLVWLGNLINGIWPLLKAATKGIWETIKRLSGQRTEAQVEYDNNKMKEAGESIKRSLEKIMEVEISLMALREENIQKISKLSAEYRDFIKNFTLTKEQIEINENRKAFDDQTEIVKTTKAEIEAIKQTPSYLSKEKEDQLIENLYHKKGMVNAASEDQKAAEKRLDELNNAEEVNNQFNMIKDVIFAGASYGTAGAIYGSSVGGPIGAIAGGAIGATVGAVSGALLAPKDYVVTKEDGTKETLSGGIWGEWEEEKKRQSEIRDQAKLEAEKQQAEVDLIQEQLKANNIIRQKEQELMAAELERLKAWKTWQQSVMEEYDNKKTEDARDLYKYMTNAPGATEIEIETSAKALQEENRRQIDEAKAGKIVVDTFDAGFNIVNERLKGRHINTEEEQQREEAEVLSGRGDENMKKRVEDTKAFQEVQTKIAKVKGIEATIQRLEGEIKLYGNNPVDDKLKKDLESSQAALVTANEELNTAQSAYEGRPMVFDTEIQSQTQQGMESLRSLFTTPEELKVFDDLLAAGYGLENLMAIASGQKTNNAQDQKIHDELQVTRDTLGVGADGRKLNTLELDSEIGKTQGKIADMERYNKIKGEDEAYIWKDNDYVQGKIAQNKTDIKTQQNRLANLLSAKAAEIAIGNIKPLEPTEIQQNVAGKIVESINSTRLMSDDEIKKKEEENKEIDKTIDMAKFKSSEAQLEIARKYMSPHEIALQNPKDMMRYFSNARNTNLRSDARLANLDKAMELSQELKKKGDEREKKNRAIDVTQKATTAGSAEAFKLENRLYNQYNRRMEEYAKQSLRAQKEANEISKQILKQQVIEVKVEKPS